MQALRDALERTQQELQQAQLQLQLHAAGEA